MKKVAIGVHWPKAGGTALRLQLESHYGSKLLKDYENHPLSEHRLEKVASLPDGIELVFGHFHASRYDLIGSAYRFSVLRHPVDTLISTFFFWRLFPRSDFRMHSDFLDNKPSIEDFARHPQNRNLMSVGYFGGFDMDSLDFLGFYEDRHKDFAKLASVLGLNLSSKYLANATPFYEERIIVEKDKQLLKSLASILKEDVEFYENQKARRS